MTVRHERGVVIGLGNPWRRDDGVGPAVADAVTRSAGPPIAVVVLDGEPARILEHWADADIAVVVDAARADDPPGTVRILAPPARPPVAPSSHGLGLAHAIELGRHLDVLPGRLVVIGIVGADFDHGCGLSPPVAAAVEPTARIVRNLVDGAQRATQRR